MWRAVGGARGTPGAVGVGQQLSGDDLMRGGGDGFKRCSPSRHAVAVMANWSGVTARPYRWRMAPARSNSVSLGRWLGFGAASAEPRQLRSGSRPPSDCPSVESVEGTWGWEGPLRGPPTERT
jgi:hypothetical protein